METIPCFVSTKIVICCSYNYYDFRNYSWIFRFVFLNFSIVIPGPIYTVSYVMVNYVNYCKLFAVQIDQHLRFDVRDLNSNRRLRFYICFRNSLWQHNELIIKIKLAVFLKIALQNTSSMFLSREKLPY